jgi:membrane-associated phospholipid phosphatase
MVRQFITVFLLLAYNILFAQCPYKITWKKDIPLLGAGILIGGSSLYFSYNTKKITAEDINDLSVSSINNFDRSAANYYSPGLATASDVVVLASVALPVVLFSDKRIRSDFFTIAFMYAETMLYAYSLPAICKGTVLRLRPILYNPDVPLSDKVDLGRSARWSFFSGHTTAAFASAFFLAKVYSDYNPKSKLTKFIYGGTIIAASTVGFLRYRSGKHFPTDILTGAAIGAIVGYGIPAIHKINHSKLSFHPGVSPYGMSLTMKF